MNSICQHAQVWLLGQCLIELSYSIRRLEKFGRSRISDVTIIDM